MGDSLLQEILAVAMAEVINKDVCSQQIFDRLPLLLRCGQNLVPTMSTSSIIQEDFDTSLSVFKANVVSCLSSIPTHSVVYCGVAVLHHLTSLIGEDFAITGHYGNCLRYLDISIASLQCLPSGSMYRVDQLDQAMVALREMLLITIVRQHRTTRQFQIDSINRVLCSSSVDTSVESEEEGPMPSLEVIEGQESTSVIISKIVPSNNNNEVCDEKNKKDDPLPGPGDSSPAPLEHDEAP